MKSRRSFFKSLALLAAGAATAPGLFIPKFEPVKWKVAKKVVFQGDLGALVTQRNAEFIRNKLAFLEVVRNELAFLEVVRNELAFLEVVTDPETHLKLLHMTLQDKFTGQVTSRMELIHGCSTREGILLS